MKYTNTITNKKYDSELDLTLDLATFVQCGFDQFSVKRALKQDWPFSKSEIKQVRKMIESLSMGNVYTLLQKVVDKPSYDFCLEYEFMMCFKLKKSTIFKSYVIFLYKNSFPGTV